jgi:hypothetical protein
MRACSGEIGEENYKQDFLSRRLYREMPFRSYGNHLEDRLCGDINQKAPKRVLRPLRGLITPSSGNPTFSFYSLEG